MLVLIITKLLHPLYEKLNPKLDTWDIVHANVPDMSNYGWIDDMIILLMGFLTIINYHSIDFIPTSKAITFFMGLRLLCILVTQLKDPQKENHCKKHNRKRIGTCTDKFFSGHTSIAIVLASALSTAFPQYKIFYWIMATFITIFATVTRDHYTIDVIIPWVLFYFYTNKTFRLS